MAHVESAESVHKFERSEPAWDAGVAIYETSARKPITKKRNANIILLLMFLLPYTDAMPGCYREAETQYTRTRKKNIYLIKYI